MLDIPYKNFENCELLGKELNKDAKEDKNGVLDIKIRLKDRTCIDLEMQFIWDNSNEKIIKLNLSPEEKSLYESRMKLKSDIVSIYENRFCAGVKQGRLEGREEGYYDARLETARNCLSLNLPVGTIAKITGLSIEEIEKL